MSLAHRAGSTLRHALDIRAWPVRGNSARLNGYLLAVILLDVAAIGTAAATTSFSLRQLVLFGFACLCSVTMVEATRRAGENAGWITDIYGIWELPIAVLLPPLYALLIPIPHTALTQLRIKHVPLHRRVFSAAMLGLSYGLASVAFHAVNQNAIGSIASADARHAAWVLAVAGCGALQWAANWLLLIPPIMSTDPAQGLKKLILARDSLVNDGTQICVGTIVAVCTTMTPVSILFALPFATLLQRSQRHGQLVSASRQDSKTGLLNAGTWEKEAGAEITRAIRTRTPLAVALVDLDSFKAVNDTYGHLSGDKALLAVARTIKVFLRDYDLVGRFGGEEFALLLPQTDEDAARGIAERIRAHIAGMPIPLSDAPDAEAIRVTVSIGVAALGSSRSSLTELLATADAALYRAKDAGRNQVWVATGSGTFPQPASAGHLESAPPGQQRTEPARG
jgi:diguanylate cyclase (GGDEF)-like protein